MKAIQCSLEVLRHRNTLRMAISYKSVKFEAPSQVWGPIFDLSRARELPLPNSLTSLDMTCLYHNYMYSVTPGSDHRQGMIDSSEPELQVTIRGVTGDIVNHVAVNILPPTSPWYEFNTTIHLFIILYKDNRLWFIISNAFTTHHMKHSSVISASWNFQYITHFCV